MDAEVKRIQVFAGVAALLGSAVILTVCISLPLFFEQLDEIHSSVETEMTGFNELTENIWEFVLSFKRPLYSAPSGQKRFKPRGKRQFRAPTPGSYFEGVGSKSFVNQNNIIGGSCNCNPSNECATGPPGLAGTPGEDGMPGMPGQPGKPGMDGEEMPMNPDFCPPCKGRPGPQGPPGEQGQEGFPGYPGPPGPPGASPPGEPGPPGEQGEDGTPGGRGRPGRPGDDAVYADPGPPGNPGITGNPGPGGPNGLPGRDASSTVGPPGPPGPAGPLGAPGFVGRPGLAGPPGPPGDAGSDAHYCPCPPRDGYRGRVDTAFNPSLSSRSPVEKFPDHKDGWSEVIVGGEDTWSPTPRMSDKWDKNAGYTEQAELEWEPSPPVFPPGIQVPPPPPTPPIATKPSTPQAEYKQTRIVKNPVRRPAPRGLPPAARLFLPHGTRLREGRRLIVRFSDQ